MRSFTLTLALVVVAHPAFARNASRHHVRVAPVPPTYAPVEQWAPQPVLATPSVRHARRMRAEAPSSFHAHASSLPNWSPTAPQGQDPRGAFAAMVSRHAQANGVPESLVHRVIVRESRYNPRAVSRGNYGLMQNSPADGTRHGLRRLGVRAARSGDQSHLRGALPRRRLPRGGRQRQSLRLLLCGRLCREPLRASQAKRDLALLGCARGAMSSHPGTRRRAGIRCSDRHRQTQPGHCGRAYRATILRGSAHEECAERLRMRRVARAAQSA